jgi:hypothetical protein
MGTGTKCNYCTFERMKENAQRNGDTLRTSVERPDQGTPGGWTLVFRNDETEPVAMFLVLTTRCAC